MMRRRTPRRLAIAMIVALAACSRHQPGVDEEPLPEPITVHVKNENFLAMNLSFVASSMSRRLGSVNGNSTGSFSVPWSLVYGQQVVIVATPIGGRGNAVTSGLTVDPGQVVEFRIAQVMNQSSAFVRDPP